MNLVSSRTSRCRKPKRRHARTSAHRCAFLFSASCYKGKSKAATLCCVTSPASKTSSHQQLYRQRDELQFAVVCTTRCTSVSFVSSANKSRSRSDAKEMRTPMESPRKRPARIPVVCAHSANRMTCLFLLWDSVHWVL